MAQTRSQSLLILHTQGGGWGSWEGEAAKNLVFAPERVL